MALARTVAMTSDPEPDRVGEARGRRAGRRVPLRPIAVPNEHGAWGFLLEPALLGLLVAPAWSGGLVVVAATAALFAQHPLSLVLADRRRGRHYARTPLARTPLARTPLARAFALGYGVVAVLALAAAIVWTGRVGALLPVLLAAPLALAQLSHDARGRGRDLLPELAGATAVGALAAVVAMAGGWPLGSALLLWLVLAARTVPSILYVRTRLRLEYGRPVRRGAATGAHLAALALVVALAALGHLPLLAVVGFVVLSARATIGVSRWRRPARAATIGFREIAFGLLVVVTTAAGYVLGS